MLTLNNLANASKIARSIEQFFEKEGAPLGHSKVLDALVGAAGFKNWNVAAATLSKDGVNEILHSFEREHTQVNEGLEYGPEVMLVAHTGFQLRYSSEAEGVDYVRVCDPLGREVAYWVSDEWQEDPTNVMGAMLGALVRGVPLKVKEQKKPKVRPSAKKAPSISDVDFMKVHSVVFNGSCFSVDWRNEDALKKLASLKTSGPLERPDDDGDIEDALNLSFVEDGLVFEENLRFDLLVSMKWSEEKRCFVCPAGSTYEFFIELSFADYYSKN